MDAFREEEVFLGIKNCAPRKSPGNDGNPKEFYMKTWNIIKCQLVNVMNDLSNGNFDIGWMVRFFLLKKMQR
jgi:hypothetical protein